MKDRYPYSAVILRAAQCLWLLVVLGIPPGVLLAGESFERPFRAGFSISMFSVVNENDAKAAVKVWGEMIAKAHHVPIDPDPAIFKNIDEMRNSLLGKKVDALGMTTLDYDSLRREIDFTPIFLSYNDGSPTDRYVLLARQDSAIKSIMDLKGKSLHHHANPRGCLAPLWLDTLLVTADQPVASRFFGKILSETKLAKVVLPVFFRQADACVVTRSGFDTMSALNPQVAKDLKVLDESVDMVTVVFAFRADYHPPFKLTLIDGMNGLRNSPAGRQLLTIFQSEHMAEHPISSMKSALELIGAHKRRVQ